MTKQRQKIKQALSKHDTGSWIETSGQVRRLLYDDHDGSRHQRFIIDTGGATLLIAHNIDIAKRIPLGIGDRVKVRGMFEWNDLGGLVHWTHHDPHGIEQGGYVRFQSRLYK